MSINDVDLEDSTLSRVFADNLEMKDNDDENSLKQNLINNEKTTLDY